MVSGLSTLYYDAWPGYLISSIRTVCKYRKCSFLTGLITSLTDLVQAYHQGRIGTSKTKSTGSPFHIPITLLSEFFCFALTESFFRPCREPVRRLPRSSSKILHCASYFQISSQCSKMWSNFHESNNKKKNKI